MTMMTREQMEQQIAELGPWFYGFDFGNGVRTTPNIPTAVTQIFDTRLEMVQRSIRAYFGSRLQSITAADIGCHEGFYTQALAREGVPLITGIDVRDINLRKAKFAASVLGYPQITFRQGNLETLNPVDYGQFDLTLFLGVLYHVENPMLCLRHVAAMTREMCVIETQVVDEVEGSTEWGAQDWTRPYQGIIAVIDESGEWNNNNTETGSTPLATCPSPKALAFMLKHCGFRHSEPITPPVGAYEQHARGKRVVWAAYK